MNVSCAGFTLLEIMVALVILTVAAAGLSGAMEQSLKQQAMLEDKTFAGWVAENMLAEMRSARQWPDIAQKNTDVQMANRLWRVTSTVTATDNPDIRKIECAVAPAKPEDASPVIVLSGFIGKN